MQIWSWSDTLKNLPYLHHLRTKPKALHMAVKTFLFWPIPFFSLQPCFPFSDFNPLPPLPQDHRSNTKYSHIYTLTCVYFTLLWLHTFISFPSAFSSSSPDEIFLKFLHVNHQLQEAFPRTPLKHDFFSTLYSSILLVSLYFHVLLPCGAAKNLEDEDHVIIFLGVIPASAI